MGYPLPSPPRRPGVFSGRPVYGGQPLTLPVATTLPASQVGQSAATLNGTVNPEGTATSAWFQWGFTAQYGNQTVPVGLGGGATTLPASASLSNLRPGITYHFRIVAQSAAGTVYGQDLAFTVLAGTPSVGLPQFDAPFRLDATGRVVVVEQDSPEEIGAAVYNVLVCEQGAKLNDPGFGREAPLFEATPLDLTAMLDAVRRLEPRADYTLDDIASVLDASQRTIAATADVADTGS